jgi:hypothetical protein
MQPSERAVLIEIEAVLKNTLFSEKAGNQAAAAVKTIQKSFRIIYLVRFVGQGLANTWLTRSDFPASVVLAWRGTQMLRHFQEKGLQLYAIIGSQSMLEAADDLIEKRFLIDVSAEGDWNKILESLGH